MDYDLIMGKPQYIAKKQIKTLAKTSDLAGFALLAHCWGVIFAMMALFVLWPNPLTFFIAVIVIAGRQLGMAILMHDAAHGILFKTPRFDKFFGQNFLAFPIGLDLGLYQTYHLKHHKYTQTDKDPDIGLSAPFPVSKSSFWRKVARDLSGMTGIRLRFGQIFKLIKSSGKNKTQSEKIFDIKYVLGPYLINVLMFIAFALAGYWWLYFALWLFPLLTVFQLFLRIRNIAEHAMTSKDDNPLTHARTTKANWIERVFVAPYWVNYHIEHHVYMYVPCWQLPKLHKAMLENGYGPEMEIKKSYLDVLRSAVKP